MWTCLRMDDAITSGCKTTVMYLFADFAAVNYVPENHFCKLPRRGKAWQTGAKRFERNTLKRSGWSGLSVKPGNISAAAANCNLLDDPSSRIRAPRRFFFFLAQWSSERNSPLRVIACKISSRCDSPTLWTESVTPFVRYNGKKIHGDRLRCKLCNRFLFNSQFDCLCYSDS